MISYQVLAGVSAAALLFLWLYYQEYQRHKNTDKSAREATAFYVSKVTPFEPDDPALWMYECCHTFVIFDKVRQRNCDFFLMEGDVIKARLNLPKEHVGTAIHYFKSSHCPVQEFNPTEFS